MTLKNFCNGELRRIFGTTREEARGKWGKTA
jgi:hypothetical protein